MALAIKIEGKPPTPEQVAESLNAALMVLGGGNLDSPAFQTAIELMAKQRLILLRHPNVRCNFPALKSMLSKIFRDLHQTAKQNGVSRVNFHVLSPALQLMIALRNEGPDGKIPVDDNEVKQIVEQVQFLERALLARSSMELQLRRRVRETICQYWLYLASAVDGDPVSVFRHFKADAYEVAQTAVDAFRYYVAAVSRAIQELLHRPAAPKFENLNAVVTELLMEKICRAVPVLNVDGATQVAQSWVLGFVVQISHFARLITVELTSDSVVPNFAVARGWAAPNDRNALKRQSLLQSAFEAHLTNLAAEKKLSPFHLPLLSLFPPLLPVACGALVLLSDPADPATQAHYMSKWVFSQPRQIPPEVSAELLSCIALLGITEPALERAVLQSLDGSSKSEAVPLRLLSLWYTYFAHGRVTDYLVSNVASKAAMKAPALPVALPPFLSTKVGSAVVRIASRDAKSLTKVLSLMEQRTRQSKAGFLVYLDLPSHQRKAPIIDGFYQTLVSVINVVGVAMSPPTHSRVESAGAEAFPNHEHGAQALDIVGNVFPMFRSVLMKHFPSDSLRDTAANSLIQAGSGVSVRAFNLVSERRETLERVLKAAWASATRKPTAEMGSKGDILAHEIFGVVAGMGSSIAARNLARVDPSRPTKLGQPEKPGSAVSILRTLWIPLGLQAIQMKAGVVGPRGHDAIIAPIRESNPWTIPLVSTYITVCAPDPEDPVPRYGTPTVSILRRFASAVRSVCQAAETFCCTDDEANSLENSKSTEGTAKLSAKKAEEVVAASGGVGASLLVVDRTRKCLMHWVLQKPTNNEVRLYAAALINLLQCSDPRVVHQVCVAVEDFLNVPTIRSNKKQYEFWREYVNQTIQRSTTSSTKSSLAEWFLTLDERIAQKELLRRSKLPSKL